MSAARAGRFRRKERYCASLLSYDGGSKYQNVGINGEEVNRLVRLFREEIKSEEKHAGYSHARGKGTKQIQDEKD